MQEHDQLVERDDFKSPPCECDIVMKGGITSGVVYPRALLKLAHKYRFRAIGGGSVGALVAALTAAAELARETYGFERLDQKRNELNSNDFIVSRFQAPQQTRPELEFLLAILSVKNETANGANLLQSIANHIGSVLFREYGRVIFTSFVFGAAVGISLLFLVAEGLNSSLSEADLRLYEILFGLLIGLLAAPFGVLGKFVYIMYWKVPKNHFFGLCHGSGAPGTAERPLLTDWLSQAINYIAGVEVEGAPLTFSDLQSTNDVNRRIELKIMTTNLNQTTPYIFPREPNTFLFHEDEMSKFFPANVVEYMVNNAPPTAVSLPEGFHVFPTANKLPIVVPVRMAISFPILLSAVPVWTIKRSAWDSTSTNQELDPKTALSRNLFSDGGICSNFPIHFFDAWLPKHPTFGINLTSIPDENDAFILDDISAPGSPGNLDPTVVWLPQADQRDNILSSKIDNIREFGMAIFHSAQNFRDTMQSQLPSYQERIVNVPLSSQEGGLNLKMDETIIASMQGKGLQAGEMLCGEEFSFDRHQWVRLRVLMSLLKKNLSEIQESLSMETSEDPCRVKKYSEILRTVEKDFPFYPEGWNEELAATIAAKLEGLGALLQDLPDVDFFDPIPPPYEIRPELRITPDL